ncbi:hypothetical protein TB2_020833 [Malus domestica]
MSLLKCSINSNNSSVQVYEEDPQLDPYSEYDDYGDNAYDNESKDDEFYESDSIPLGHYLGKIPSSFRSSDSSPIQSSPPQGKEFNHEKALLIILFSPAFVLGIILRLLNYAPFVLQFFVFLHL